MSDSVDSIAQDSHSTIPLGSLLVLAREEQQLSVDDVASRLRMSSRQITALENDDFSALPEPMITRGFIRNYARLLHIDSEPLLQAYSSHVPSNPYAITIPSANILISGKDKRPWLTYIAASLMIAVLLAAWMIYTEYYPQHPMHKLTSLAQTNSPKQATENAPQQTAAEPMPVPALPAAERTGEQTSTTDVVLPSTERQPDQAATARTGTSAVSNTPATSAIKTPALTSSAGRLKFTFKESSWVRVSDRDGKVILNTTKPAGSEEVLEGQPPFKVVIGNVTGSQLVFNDKPVDLGPYTKLNVARITLE